MARYLILLTVALVQLWQIQAAEVCNIHCDGRDSTLATAIRDTLSVEIFSRKLTLKMADVENMGFGLIENGNPGDEVWLDRSFDGGISWTDGSRIGNSVIPSGSRQTQTLMFNVDDPSNTGIGALRVCGKAGDRPEIACTSWARSTVNAERPIDAAATAMMQFYSKEGLWKTTGWWNSGNCMTAIIDYSRETGSLVYRYAFDRTFEAQKNSYYGDFTNEYIDDTLWWGLAWADAYDLTGDYKFLEMAKIDADFAYSYKDDVCGGGLWWTDKMTYKNAIPNELFIKLAAVLHNLIPGDEKYLAQSIEVWNWFRNSGMINNENLINDGLTADCKNNGQVTWTYNQGVIIGGLVELHKATGDQYYLDEARKIADAVVASTYLNNANGILIEPCEHADCGGDAPSFKGSFIRNFGELDRYLPGRPYLNYLKKQTDSMYANGRNSLDQYSVHWAGPFDKADAASQHSALEAFTAAFV